MDNGTCLYRLYDDQDQLLYVGISHRHLVRLHQHSKDKPWWTQGTRATLTHYPNRAAALEAEREAIVSECPAFNVVHNAAPVPAGLRDNAPTPKQRGWVNRDEHHEQLARQTQRLFRCTPDDFWAQLAAGDIDPTNDRTIMVLNNYTSTFTATRILAELE